jgi:uncharacterized delta-60 repeat protein
MDARSSWLRLSLLAFACALLATLPVPFAWAAPGDLDPSFGGSGMVITDLGVGGAQANAVAIQPDGKIVAAGTSGSEHFVVVRYLADGTLDATFGNGGKAVPDLGGIFEQAYGLALQPDGKIVLVGTTAPQGYCCQYVVARLLPDGALDAGFGTRGRVFTTLAGGLQSFGAVAIQPDGKIVAAGGGYSSFGSALAVVRYLSNGTLDSTFGSSGAALFAVGGNSLANGPFRRSSSFSDNSGLDAVASHESGPPRAR